MKVNKKERNTDGRKKERWRINMKEGRQEERKKQRRRGGERGRKKPNTSPIMHCNYFFTDQHYIYGI